MSVNNGILFNSIPLPPLSDFQYMYSGGRPECPKRKMWPSYGLNLASPGL